MKKISSILFALILITYALSTSICAAYADGRQDCSLTEGSWSVFAYTEDKSNESSDDNDTDASAYSPDGYVFQIKDSFIEKETTTYTDVLFNKISDELSKTDEVYEEAGLYHTDDIEVIERLECLGALEQYEEDGLVSLCDLSGDMEAVLTQSIKDYRYAMLGYDYTSRSDITGKGVKIAVIDSGLCDNFSNQSRAEVITGTNLIVDSDSDKHNDVSDTVGHGTFVTSIICGDEIGLVPEVSILPLKCFDSKNSSFSSVIKAIGIAIEEDCDIINMSFGSTYDNPFLEEAVQLALSKSIILVASSGNLSSKDGASTGNDALMYPASYDGVISVGAVDSTKTVWNRSYQNSGVDVVAPGVTVKGLYFGNGAFITSNGTSFAAPVVTATAALALSVNHDLTVTSFTDLLASTSEDLGATGKDNSYGYGLVNPALLLATLTEDDKSLILSAWDEKIGVSAFTDDSDDFDILAFYDSDGRMLVSSTSAKHGFCNVTLPDEVKAVKLFRFDRDFIALTSPTIT